MSNFTVAIKDTETGAIEQTIGSASSARLLERTERGVNINLNHAEYHTEIIEVPDEQH